MTDYLTACLYMFALHLPYMDLNEQSYIVALLHPAGGEVAVLELDCRWGTERSGCLALDLPLSLQTWEVLWLLMG